MSSRNMIRLCRNTLLASAFVMAGGLFFLFLSGCSTTDTLSIPRAPTWQQPSDTSPIAAWQVRVTVNKLRPGVPVDISDFTFTRISHAWLERYVEWTWEAAKALGIRYTPESFDCENFARLFNEIVRLKASQAGVQAAPLCAEVWIMMPAGAHSIVGVATDKGIFLIEPQPDAGPFRIKALADFPYPITAIRNL